MTREFANINMTCAVNIGIAKTSKVFFRPILSDGKPERIDPNIVPKPSKEVIRDDSSVVAGKGRGLSFGSFKPFNFGKTGDVHEYNAPVANDIKLTVEKMLH